MIWLYTGTPGSGKSLHAAKDIVKRMRRGGGLICNFPINEGAVKKARSRVTYWDNSEMKPEKLVAYAMEHHRIGKENQTLVVIDEAQIILNCRDFGAKDRTKWVELFCQHRKLGFNFILITQNDRMLDKQVRALVEYEVRHRKMNNYGFGGLIVSLTFTSWFAAIEYWYGMKGPDAKLGISFFPYTRKYSRIYDSYRMFSDMAAAGGAGEDPRSGRTPGEASGVQDDERLGKIVEFLRESRKTENAEKVAKTENSGFAPPACSTGVQTVQGSTSSD